MTVKFTLNDDAVTLGTGAVVLDPELPELEPDEPQPAAPATAATAKAIATPRCAENLMGPFLLKVLPIESGVAAR
jgi:hypothetical protein